MRSSQPNSAMRWPVHAHSGLEGGVPQRREAQKPHVVAGVTRIRSCCIEDSADPTPRVTWWLFFEKDFQQAQVGRDQEEVARLHAYYPRLKEDLAKVIPRPSLAEEALWFCMMSLVQDPRIGESPQQRRARLLGEARRTLDEKNPAVVGERTPLLARPSGEGGGGPARTTSRSSSCRRRRGNPWPAEGGGYDAVVLPRARRELALHREGREGCLAPRGQSSSPRPGRIEPSVHRFQARLR